MHTGLAPGCLIAGVAVWVGATTQVACPIGTCVAVSEVESRPIRGMVQIKLLCKVGIFPFGMTKDELERIVVGIRCNPEAPLKLGIAIGIIGDVADVGDTRRTGHEQPSSASGFVPRIWTAPPHSPLIRTTFGSV